MSYSAVTIGNEALSELRAPSIVSLDEESVEAQAVNRVYQQCLDEMLEAHEWGFAIRRVVLAQVTNDRDAEWAFAYAVPADLGTAKRIVPTITSDSAVAAYPYTYSPAYAGSTMWTDFIIENGIIYATIDTATLEYGINDVDVGVMPALFRRALALNIAARIAVPLRDSREMKADLQKEANLAMQRAMADDLNRQPNREPYDDVSHARQGGALGWGVAGHGGFPIWRN